VGQAAKIADTAQQIATNI